MNHLGVLKVDITFPDLASADHAVVNWGGLPEVPALAASVDLFFRVELHSNLGFEFALWWIRNKYWTGQSWVAGNFRPVISFEKMHPKFRFVSPLSTVFAPGVVDMLRTELDAHYMWQLLDKEHVTDFADCCRFLAKRIRRALPGISDYVLGRIIINCMPFHVPWDKLPEAFPWPEDDPHFELLGMTPTQFFERLKSGKDVTEKMLQVDPAEVAKISLLHVQVFESV